MNKKRIINEIKRTAKANNGQVLGRARFLNETGIKESDWQGKFWVRWSDAVREAGFEPQEWQVTYDDELLINKILDLTRELGHFPVNAEL